jgi:hypothetical protein
MPQRMGGREVKANPGPAQLPMRQRALQDGKTDQMGLARHRARTLWGLLTSTAATIGAHVLVRTCLAGQ